MDFNNHKVGRHGYSDKLSLSPTKKESYRMNRRDLLQPPAGLLSGLGLDSDPKKVAFVGQGAYDYLVEVCIFVPW